jgi:hypothetical protein
VFVLRIKVEKSAWRNFCHSPATGAAVLKEKPVNNFVLPGSGFYLFLFLFLS